jgi:hypothetical protein
MQNDIYIKAVLTVIAVALVGILIRDIPIVSTAHAESTGGPVQVDIVAIDGKPFGRLSVSRLGAALPVQIEGSVQIDR